MELAPYLLALAAAICVGISKTGFSGASMVSVLIFAELFGAKASVGIALPLLIVADLAVYPVFRHHASWRQVWPLLPPAILGVIGGTFLLNYFDNATARPVIGGIIAVMILLQFVRKQFRSLMETLPDSTGFAWACGTFGGLATTLANAAGPVMSIYLLLRKFPKLELLGIHARFFLFINLFKVPFNVSLDILNARSLLMDLTLIPGVLAGVFIGKRLIKKIPQKLFDILLISFATIASLRLLFF